jgi:hypothetical protein
MSIITGTPICPQDEMASSPFNFYLTGSRFFGYHSEMSDWDYFVEDTVEVREFLTNLGFSDMATPILRPSWDCWNDQGSSRLSEKFYDLQNMQGTNAIFEHSKTHIHVQLVQDPILKNEIQILLKKHGFPWSVANKRQLRKIWNLAFQLSSASRKN